MRLSRLLLIISACLLAGCIEIHQQLTLNPDRSARLRLTLRLDPAKLDTESLEGHFDFDHELRQAEESMRELTSSIMENATGVDAWTDHQFEKDPAGVITTSITGYIPDLQAFRLIAGEDADLPNVYYRFSHQEDRQSVRLCLQGINDYQAPAKRPEISNDEADTLAERLQRQYADEEEGMRFMLEPMILHTDLRLPGPLTSAQNLRRLSSREARLTLAGKQLLALHKNVLANEALLRQLVKRGWNLEQPMPLPEKDMNQRLFGQHAPVQVTWRPSTRPLFDYTRELARARQSPAGVAPQP